MAVRPVLLLGDERLVTPCREVSPDELPAVRTLGEDLRDTLRAFREEHGSGRAVAAPQIGALVRVVYLHVPEPAVLVNPRLSELSSETFELWDDCMSFPELLVRVRRHRSCRLTYRDLDWERHEVGLKDDLSELLQHECDHLDGILAVARAAGPAAFALRRQRKGAEAGPLPR